ncbi:hypothetical protein [Alsobacter sp. R-9]
MTQAFDVQSPVAFAAGSAPTRLATRFAGILRRLLTDGLTADAFLVLQGGMSVAVLLRRPGGEYVTVSRVEGTAELEGRAFAEPELARDAVARHVGQGVTLAPVWYS